MKPYPWQEPLIDAVVASILRDNVFVSGFPTGSGKTVIALAAAKRLNRPHLVVAPKVALTQWRRTADAMSCGDRLVDVVNPEKISSPRGCSWYDRATKWHLPQGTLVTWDEPHRSASGPDSVSACAMAELKAYPGFALHAMSATIADSPMKLRAVGYWTGLHRWNMASYTKFLFDHGCASVVVKRTPPIRRAIKFTSVKSEARRHMLALRSEMGGKFMSLRPEEIPGFPEQTVKTLLVDLSARDAAEIDRIHASMSERLLRASPNDMAEIGHERERIEILLAPALAELAVSAVENGESAVVFWNFTEPRLAFEKLLSDVDVAFASVHGGQKDDDRQDGIDRFQRNEVFVASVMLEAGGAALSLHDELKARPRVSFIPPAWRADSVKQCLGRIRRCNGTNVTQNFVLAAGTVQERVAKSLERKLENLDFLNDGDFQPQERHDDT